MKSNYKQLGDYIREVKDRNSDGKPKTLLGINIDKYFMPSVANIVGTDLTKYKIVNKNQFACNRMHVGRDKRLPVALSKNEDGFIVSPAYDVFEIIDENILSPEYLMMWFSRKEFDRNAWFYTDADVRGGLSWSAFCNMDLPVPDIEKQKAIVKEYNTIVERIKLNEQLNKKLEETAQAVYKQWFVDFEFPDKNGKPYKSSGGDMEYNAELDKEIPNGWDVGPISSIVNTQYGYTASATTDVVGPKFLRITDIAQPYIAWDSVPYCSIEKTEVEKYKIMDGDIVVARTGATVGYAKRLNTMHPDSIFASYLVRITPHKETHKIFIGLTFVSKQFLEFIQNVAGGSGQPQASATLMTEYSTVLPEGSSLDSFNKAITPFLNQAEIYQMQICRLKEIKSLLLTSITYKSGKTE